MYGCMLDEWMAVRHPATRVGKMVGGGAVFVSVHHPSFPQISSFFRPRGGEERSNERGGSELYAVNAKGAYIAKHQRSFALCTRIATRKLRWTTVAKQQTPHIIYEP